MAAGRLHNRKGNWHCKQGFLRQETEITNQSFQAQTGSGGEGVKKGSPGDVMCTMITIVNTAV